MLQCLDGALADRWPRAGTAGRKSPKNDLPPDEMPLWWWHFETARASVYFMERSFPARLAFAKPSEGR